MKAAQAMQQQKDSEFVIDESVPYAELWIGTHPSGMSTVIVNNDQQTLLEYVKSDPELHCGKKESAELSFLFKVLSISKVLSIQAHPDKKLAEHLHAASPHIYKDPNHKPEMAIALSEQVQAMVGFRPIHEIAEHIQAYPEFRALLGDQVADEVISMARSPATRAVLQHMFKAYLESPKETVQAQLTCLLDRLKSIDECNELQNIMIQFSEQFPGDSGIMAPLMLNVVTFPQGEAIFIAANEPHAYISGELIECMACSDNVVRAGLTPKLKDVPTLVNMLTYKSQVPELYHGHVVDDCTIRYEPPVPDFCVEIVCVAPGETYELGDLESPCVILTLSGSATLVQDNVCSMDVSFGSSAFLSAKTRATVVAGPNGVRLTRAFTNIYHDDYKYAGLEF
jgi:mannose-6-phosphate isomerase